MVDKERIMASLQSYAASTLADMLGCDVATARRLKLGEISIEDIEAQKARPKRFKKTETTEGRGDDINGE